jgi:cytochrome b subunit of formate dehydrogenase
MSLLTIIIVLIVTGVILWLINSFIPMQATVKRILNVVVVIALIVWLLKAFHLFDSLLNIRV